MILGISAFYHDSAAALVDEGKIVAAAQEERFSRRKHDHSFPSQAIQYCLKEAGIAAKDLKAVVYYEKPFLKFERLLLTYLSTAPRGWRSFLKAMPLWLKEKIFLKETLAKALEYSGDIFFVSHHESHAASAFFPSPFEEAAILTMDGVGEWTTASWGTGQGSRVTLGEEIRFPHSLGLLYSAFTYYLGFRVNSGEYKVMGLAPYGRPRYADKIREHLITIRDDGSFCLNRRYFNYCTGLTMTNQRFHELFGGPPRRPESTLDQRHADLARSVQEVTEEVMLKMARFVHRRTGMKNLCLAGGVALNCVGNGRILREGPFERLWIQPAAGDAGGALGAALLGWHHIFEQPRRADHQHDRQQGSYLGPRFSPEEIRSFLNRRRIPSHEVSDADLPDLIARLLDEQNVVGFFQGRMEFGPRALGGRSILGDPRSTEMQSTLNLKIKFRESFRPFAPSVLEEKVSEFFDLDVPSPYMLLVAPVSARHRTTSDASKHESSEGNLMVQLKTRRSTIPAVTHVDGSARIQTVSRETNPRFYDVIDAFGRLTGVPVVINTSFNIRGEPIVATPEDAYRCFMATNMDVLVLEDFVLYKNEQPEDEKVRREEITQILD